MKIVITLYNDLDVMLSQRSAMDFESAEEDLGKLQSWYEREQNEILQKLQDDATRNFNTT